MPHCTACGTENPAIAKFCLACGTPIAAPAPPDQERKQVTALFVDIVGSTSRAEQLDPEEVHALLEPYYARLRVELERHGGTVEKFIGDAVVALFGAPLAHEDDPERAVRAGLGIIDAIGALNAEDPTRNLRVRIGVTTGSALVALGARVAEGQGMAWGDVMNTAARLQSAAPVNRIAVDERTHAATEAAIVYEAAEPIVAKGKAEPVPVWIAVRAQESPAARGRARAALIGRDHELARVSALWDEAVSSGEPRLGLLVAAPGVGKSRLLAETVERTAARAHWGRCLSYGEGITYWPVRQIVQSLAGILQSDSPQTVSTKAAELIECLPTTDVDELRTIASAVASLTGAETTPRGTYVTDEISQAELHWGVRRLLELVAAERPLLVVLEDVHWAEPTLLDLLESIVRDARAPLLLLASGRPELGQVRPALLETRGRRLVLELEPLGDEDCALLLRELLGADADARAIQAVTRNAGGNPLFLEETVRMLVDSGKLDEADWDGDALPVPSSLEGLIGSRLDALPSREKRVAQHASVAGSTFWSGAVAYLDEASPEPDEALTELERRDVVLERETSSVAAEREWTFKHVLLRDVAYGRLPKTRRATLHLRFADWIVAHPGAEEEFVEIVAYHLEQACRLARAGDDRPLDRALDTLTRAGERAERREGVREARRYYERALELVGDERAELRVELRYRRASMLVALGELRAAVEELTEIAYDARRLERLDVRCGAMIALANIAFKQGHASEEERCVREAEALAAELGDRRLMSRAAYEAATGRAHFAGAPADAVASLRYGLGLAREIGDRTLQVEGHMRLGSILINMGSLEEAEGELRRCFALAGEAGSYRDEARAAYLLAYVQHYRGEEAESERLCARAAEWLERTADALFQIQNLNLQAVQALGRGAHARAEQLLKQALPLALEGEALVLDTYRLLTEAIIREGRLDEARQLVEFAGRSLPAEDPIARAQLRLAEAAVAVADGDCDAAAEGYLEAIRLFEEHQCLTDLAEASLALGRALRALGDQARARAALGRAGETAEQIGAAGIAEAAAREASALPAATAVHD
jgi:class 3 adenylate cyclase/tetratricopeptide (TPR) repeat protein